MGRVPGCGSTPEEVERDNVMSVVTREDILVTYADGTAMGALFEDEHRYALTWEELPTAWIVAIVAAEDGRFWSHSGIDATHVARAARDNLGAGAVVAGGSTLSQQTAKNLFERQGRSLGAKFQELDYALHLEDVFEKHEILTFYANLFHVTGNGEGLGVAARYFFDKQPEQLTLLECAYLAGIVKGPANYDPHRGGAEVRKTALERARDRTRYVLSRIVEEDLDNLVPTSGDRIPASEVTALKAEASALLDDLPSFTFANGEFRFPRTVAVDEVEAQLQSEYFQDVLARAGIEDALREGLVVVTSLDLYQQHEAVYALRHHLTEVGLWMEEAQTTTFVRPDDPAPAFDPQSPPIRHAFRSGVVVGRTDRTLDIDLGGHLCVVDNQGIARAVDALHRGSIGNRAAWASKAARTALIEALSDGSVIEVSIRDTPTSGPARCDLEWTPELQGAVVVVENGEMRAMVGGNPNRDFNRVKAKRQFGSTFKPLIFHAALNLGWQPDDPLENQKQTFRFAGTDYAPRPDHTPAPLVSMAWAGVKSENIASVWLLAHLVDRVPPEQLRTLAASLGLGPAEGEAVADYEGRLRSLGVNLDAGSLVEVAYLEAKRDVADRLQSLARPEEAAVVRALPYDGEDRSFVALQRTAEQCREAYQQLKQSLRSTPRNPPNLWARLVDGQVALACGHQPAGYQRPRRVIETAQNRTQRRRRPRLFARPLANLVRKADVQLPGGLSLGAVGSLERAMPADPAAAARDLPPTDPRRLKANPDFRWLVALRYVQDLAKRYGVTSELPDVMSLPLGSVEISLQEAALLYAGITSGQTATASATDVDGTPLPTPPSPTLIAEIRDGEGRVIFKATPDPGRVASPRVATLTADILRNVVEHGTGRRARGLATVDGTRIPLGGKTGTTNDFKNAAFVGFVPGPAERGFSAATGAVVASYVGYDDNRPMTRGNIRLSGASGALPAWMGTVAGRVRFAPPDRPRGVAPSNAGWPLDPGSLVAQRVETASGLPQRDGEGQVLVARSRVVDLPGGEPTLVRPVTKPRSRQRRRWWRFW